MNMQVDKQQRVPVYMQIVNTLKARILSGELPEASVLPSERGMARMLGVHRNTVAKAYGELKADGLLQSKQGFGYVVAVEGAGVKDGAARRGTVGGRGKPVNWVNQIKPGHLDMDKSFDDLFERADGASNYSMGSGISQPGVFQRDKIARDISSLIETKDVDKGFYSPYKGDRSLRQKLADFLSTKGVKASVGEIQVLQETNQAFSFLLALLVKPGDTIITEEPVSPDVYRMAELAGAGVCCVPVDEDGVDCEVLEEIVRQKKPRLIFVNSSFHDPTGVVLSAERRKRVIEISNIYRVPVIEEDAASELVYEGRQITPLKAMDTLDNVIYLYSFSLTFVPGLSLAFVAANKSVIESLSYLVSVNMAAPDWMTQKLAAMYLEDGTYYAALDEFRASYRRKQEFVCARLDEMIPLGVEYTRPRGGVYVWCRLPDGVDSKLYAGRAYSKGATVIPGHVFYPNKKEGRSHIRINYSHESEERLGKGMDILRETLEELLEENTACDSRPPAVRLVGKAQFL